MDKTKHLTNIHNLVDMKIEVTQHFTDRSKQRYSNKEIDYMLNTFKYICKLLKKGKLYQRTGNTEDTKQVMYGGLTYIYSKKSSIYYLITIY